MYLSAPFILQDFKQFLGTDPDLWGCPISGSKMAHLPEQNFFGTNHYLLSSTYWHFSLCKTLKNSYSRSRVMRMHHFWAQNGPYAPNNIFFFLKIINIILIYLLAPFIAQNFKKILQADPELWGCTIFGSTMAHFPK